MIALKKAPTWMRPCVSLHAGVGVGGTKVEVGASVGVKAGKGVGVALAGSVTGVALGVEEGIE
jgi:hypothetical protein